jgi:hypothetical protein
MYLFSLPDEKKKRLSFIQSRVILTITTANFMYALNKTNITNHHQMSLKFLSLYNQ